MGCKNAIITMKIRMRIYLNSHQNNKSKNKSSSNESNMYKRTYGMSQTLLTLSFLKEELSKKTKFATIVIFLRDSLFDLQSDIGDSEISKAHRKYRVL